MADVGPETPISISGWVVKVTTPGDSPVIRHFIAAVETAREAELEVRAICQGDHVEVVRQCTVPNMMGFKMRPGEVRQYDQ